MVLVSNNFVLKVDKIDHLTLKHAQSNNLYR